MEALLIVFVFAAAALIFGGVWFMTAREGRNADAERDQLVQYRETLQKKALRAQVERWDESMVDRIADQLAEVEHRIRQTTERA